MAVRDVDGDVVWRQAQRQQLGHGVVVGLLDAQGDRGVQASCGHALHKFEVVKVKAVHHVKVAGLGQPDADVLTDHGLHVGWHHWQPEAARPELDAGVALRAAVHTAFARQQQDVVVVKDVHGAGRLFKKSEPKKTGPQLLGPGA